MQKKDEIVEELLVIILKQYKEIEELRTRINRIKQYINVYEEYIKGDK